MFLKRQVISLVLVTPIVLCATMPGQVRKGLQKRDNFVQVQIVQDKVTERVKGCNEAECNEECEIGGCESGECKGELCACLNCGYDPHVLFKPSTRQEEDCNEAGCNEKCEIEGCKSGECEGDICACMDCPYAIFPSQFSAGKKDTETCDFPLCTEGCFLKGCKGGGECEDGVCICKDCPYDLSTRFPKFPIANKKADDDCEDQICETECLDKGCEGGWCKAFGCACFECPDSSPLLKEYHQRKLTTYEDRPNKPRPKAL